MENQRQQASASCDRERPVRRSRLRHRRHVQAGWLAQAGNEPGCSRTRVDVGPRDVSAAGAVGWLLAEGTETATTEGREPVELAYGWAELARNACGRTAAGYVLRFRVCFTWSAQSRSTCWSAFAATSHIPRTSKPMIRRMSRLSVSTVAPTYPRLRQRTPSRVRSGTRTKPERLRKAAGSYGCRSPAPRAHDARRAPAQPRSALPAPRRRGRRTPERGSGGYPCPRLPSPISSASIDRASGSPRPLSAGRGWRRDTATGDTCALGKGGVEPS